MSFFENPAKLFLDIQLHFPIIGTQPEDPNMYVLSVPESHAPFPFQSRYQPILIDSNLGPGRVSIPVPLTVSSLLRTCLPDLRHSRSRNRQCQDTRTHPYRLQSWSRRVSIPVSD